MFRRKLWGYMPLGLAVAMLSACSAAQSTGVTEEPVAASSSMVISTRVPASQTPTPAPTETAAPTITLPACTGGRLIITEIGGINMACADGSNLTAVAGYGGFRELSISPDGKYLAFTSRFDTLDLLDLSSGHVDSLIAGTGSASGIHWAADSQSFRYMKLPIGAVLGNEPLIAEFVRLPSLTISDYNVTVRGLSYGSIPYKVSWSPDGKHTLLSTLEATRRAYRAEITCDDATSTCELSDVRPARTDGVLPVAWSPDSTEMAQAGFQDGDAVVSFVNLDDEVTKSINMTQLFEVQEIYALAWSPDGTRIAVVSRLHGVPSRLMIIRIADHTLMPYNVPEVFEPDHVEWLPD